MGSKWELWEIGESIENLVMYGIFKQSWITNFTFIYNINNELLYKVAESNFFLCMPAYFVDVLKKEKIKSKLSFLNGIYFYYNNIKYHYVGSEVRLCKKQWLHYGSRLFANEEKVIEAEIKVDYSELEVLFKDANIQHVKLMFIALILIGSSNDA